MRDPVCLQAAAALEAAAAAPPGLLQPADLRGALQAVSAALGSNAAGSAADPAGTLSIARPDSCAASVPPPAAAIIHATRTGGGANAAREEMAALGFVAHAGDNAEPLTSADLRYRAGLASQLQATRAALLAALAPDTEET